MKLSSLFYILAGLAACVASATSAGEQPGAQPTDWAGDLTFLRRELPNRHPNLFFRTPRKEFEAELDAIIQARPGLDDGAIALRLQELAVKMGDDHTSVGWAQHAGKKATLPLVLYWFTDGWRIISTDRGHRALLGKKLTAIGGIPMNEVESRLARLISQNPQVVKSRLPSTFVFPAALRHCALATDDALKLTTQDDAGAVSETSFSLSRDAKVENSELVNFEPTAQPYGFMNQRAIMWQRLMAKNHIFYVQYNRCEGREVAERLGASPAVAAQLPSLEDAFVEVETQLRAALAKGDADRFVLDLRFNPGGASDFGTRFAEKVARLPQLKEPGRVFVIIGRRTFSSAIINAGDFKRLTGAILVGEATSGTPNHYGETARFSLPSSGLTITHSTKYFGAPGAALEPLRPDVPAEMSFDQFRRGSDPTITAILNQIKARSATPTTPGPH